MTEPSYEYIAKSTVDFFIEKGSHTPGFWHHYFKFSNSKISEVVFASSQTIINPGHYSEDPPRNFHFKITINGSDLGDLKQALTDAEFTEGVPLGTISELDSGFSFEMQSSDTSLTKDAKQHIEKYACVANEQGFRELAKATVDWAEMIGHKIDLYQVVTDKKWRDMVVGNTLSALIRQ
jgi:hypothetical protein